MGSRRGAWPGLNFDDLSLAEVREKIRGTGGGATPLPPGVRTVGEVLRDTGFGEQRGRDDERDE